MLAVLPGSWPAGSSHAGLLPSGGRSAGAAGAPPPRQKPPVPRDWATVHAWGPAVCRRPAGHHPPAESDSSTSAWVETRVWPPPRKAPVAVMRHCRWTVHQAVQARHRLACCAPGGRKRSGVSSWWPCSTAPAKKSASTAARGPVQRMHYEVNPARWPASARPPAASTTPPSATPDPPCSADAQPEGAEAEGQAARLPAPTGHPPPQR